ncbi:hypothetical protein G6F31_019932 [Rhizopus arrhizus]|nr:hypothetical protein G6F31_019932 [Rhizopus arrhizus]
MPRVPAVAAVAEHQAAHGLGVQAGIGGGLRRSAHAQLGTRLAHALDLGDVALGVQVEGGRVQAQAFHLAFLRGGTSPDPPTSAWASCFRWRCA